MILRKIFILLLPLSFFDCVTMQEQNTTRGQYTKANGTYCPCHFFPHYFESRKGDTNETEKDFMCVGIVPLQAGSATNENDTVDALEKNQTEDDVFDTSYVQKACEYYGGDVISFQTVDEAIARGVMKLPKGAVFFVADECAYVDDRGTHKEDCNKLLTDNYMELTLCEANKTINLRPNCRCPCGFYYEKSPTEGGTSVDRTESESCIGCVNGCEAFESIEGMFLLSFTIHPRVGLIASLPNNATEPPERWPNDTLFFIDTPIGEQCGFKNASRGGKLDFGSCKFLLKEYAFFSILMILPEEPYKKPCPKDPAAVDCGGYMVRQSVAIFGLVEIITVVVISLIRHQRSINTVMRRYISYTSE